MTIGLRIATILGCTLFGTLGIKAQAKMEIDRTVANLGEVMYQIPTKTVFTITNKGNEPLVIKDVNPSCGCTIVEWSKQPIAAGETGTIATIYDAKMLGVFQKDLEVYSNISDEPLYLHLQGRVVTQPSDYTGTFPFEMGNVRLSINNIEFDDVNRGDQPVIELQVVNMGRTAYKPELMHLPHYLTAEYLPEKLSGGRVGRIRLKLDSKKLVSMGLTQTSIYLARFVGDKVSEENEVSVSAVLLPDFSKLSLQDRANAPIMHLSADSLDLGSMDGKKKITRTLTISNTGKSPLEIRSVQLFNNALNVKIGDRVLDPGQTTDLKITVLAKYLKKAKNRPRVLIITNDPQHPKRVISINVEQ